MARLLAAGIPLKEEGKYVWVTDNEALAQVGIEVKEGRGGITVNFKTCKMCRRIWSPDICDNCLGIVKAAVEGKIPLTRGDCVADLLVRNLGRLFPRVRFKGAKEWENGEFTLRGEKYRIPLKDMCHAVLEGVRTHKELAAWIKERPS